MSALPNKDFWTATCTLKRLVRSTNTAFQEEDKDVIVLQNEPCCFYNKGQRTVTPDGTVWKKQPRVTISPEDGVTQPEIDDVLMARRTEH
jgi:hypothetical protein